MEASASWFILQVILGRERVKFEIISHSVDVITNHDGFVIDVQGQFRDGTVTYIFKVLVNLIHRGIRELTVTDSLA